MNLIRYCVELQDSFNKQLDQDWINKRSYCDWALTILTEVAEFIESLDWKWWKSKQIDIQNLKLEAVDLLHFIISDLIQLTLNTDNVVDILRNTEKQKCTIRDLQKVVGFIQILSYELDLLKNNIPNDGYARIQFELLKRGLIENLKKLLSYILYIAHFNNKSELFKLYVFKNALNRLRQDYGYKQGSYNKFWDGKHEDNYFMMQLINSIEDPTVDEAYKLLETKYQECRGLIKDE